MSVADGQQLEPWPYAPADAHGWPTAAECADASDFASELCRAKLAVRQKRTDQEIARAKADIDAGIAVEQAYYTAVLEVARGAVERARASAELVQKASAAIVTLYTGILALAFSVAERPLPGKALFAAVLLGAAVVLSTAFLAYLPDGDAERERRAITDADGATLGERLTNAFARWTRRTALQRARLLRASVAALAAAVVLLPAPFVTLGEREPAADPIAWPQPPAGTAADLELRRILYTAQVAEAAEQRGQPIAGDSGAALWWLVFGAGVVATGLAALLPLPRREGTQETGGS